MCNTTLLCLALFKHFIHCDFSCIHIVLNNMYSASAAHCISTRHTILCIICCFCINRICHSTSCFCRYKIVILIVYQVTIQYSDGTNPVNASNRHLPPSNRHLSPNNRHLSPSNRHLSPSNRHMSPSNGNMSSSNRHLSPSNIHLSAKQRWQASEWISGL